MMVPIADHFQIEATLSGRVLVRPATCSQVPAAPIPIFIYQSIYFLAVVGSYAHLSDTAPAQVSGNQGAECIV